MAQAIHPLETPAAEERAGFVWEGLIAGFVGYFVIALLVGLYDVASGRSFFFTAAMLGEAAFYDLRDPAAVTVWPGAVLAYNGAHLVVFLVIGILGAWLVHLAERGSHLWFLGIVLFLVVVVHAFGAVLLMTEGLRAVLPAWVVTAVTVLGVLAMGYALQRERPALRERLGSWND